MGKLIEMYKEFGPGLVFAKLISKFNYDLYISYIKNTLEKDIIKDVGFSYVEDDANLIKVKEDNFKIFVFWWQGEDYLPEIVKLCIDSIKKNSYPFAVHLITKYNYEEYVEIDSVIKEKLLQGRMTLTHFSDILRFYLLYQYGGAWLDATIFLSSSIGTHKEFYTSSLFTQKFTHDKLRTSKNPSYGRWAGFCMSTNLIHHPLFSFGKKFFNFYWNKHNILIDYFLIDYVILLGYELIPVCKNEIDNIPLNNNNIFKLMDNITKPKQEILYEYKKWKAMENQTWIFKMSYKRPLPQDIQDIINSISNDEFY